MVFPKIRRQLNTDRIAEIHGAADGE